MSNPEIALIGSGPISHFHVPALRSADLDVNAVASMNPDSETVADFAEEFDIERSYRGDEWRTMLDERDWDGVVIATHIAGLPEALEYTLEAEVPILVEKPVAWTSDRIASLRQKADGNVIVGYNRRYYRPVLQAREFLSDHRPVMATIELPDDPPTLEQFLAMSCHGTDLLRYLFGDLTVLDTHELVDDGDLQGFTATVRSEADDLINVIGNWDTPSNMGINIDFKDLRYQIEPYEQARKLQGFRVEEPTEETPIRRYIPQEIETIDLEAIDQEYKPGFHQQARSFKSLVTNGTIHDTSATLADAEKAIDLCERLLPERLPDDAPSE